MATNVVCEMCGITYRGRVSYQYKDGPHTFCYRCQRKREKERQRADNIIRSRAYRIKQKLIQERGRYCEVCGASPEQLHGHHITPLREGGDNSSENMQLLCAECHTKAHPNGTRY